MPQQAFYGRMLGFIRVRSLVLFELTLLPPQSEDSLPFFLRARLVFRVQQTLQVFNDTVLILVVGEHFLVVTPALN